MEKRFEDERILGKIDREKRNFIKNVIIGTAFAVPVINSFSMDGLKIDLKAKMARADDYDKPEGYDKQGGGIPASSYDDGMGRAMGMGKVGSK